MPAAPTYYAPGSRERKTLFTAAERERNIRLQQYERALKYYLGQPDDQLETPEGEPDDNVSYNLVKMTADRTVAFLFPELPQIETDRESLEETPEETYIKRFLAENGGIKTLSTMALRGFLAGHTFVRVKPIPEAQAANPALRGKLYPRLVLYDPTTVTIYWNASDISEVLWFEHRYHNGLEYRLIDFLKLPDLTWEIREYRRPAPTGNVETLTMLDGRQLTRNLESYAADDSWELVGEVGKHTSVIPPVIAISHLPHPDSPYGLSEARDTDLVDTINRTLSLMNSIIRRHAEPDDVVTGADVQDVEHEAGSNLFVISNPAAKIQRLELKSDLTSVTDTLDRQVAMYLAVARVVLLRGEAKDLQRVTNASVRTLFLDALAKNALLWDGYGRGLEQICKLALQMAFAVGIIENNPEMLEIRAVAPQPLPTDELEVATVNATSVQGGWMDKQSAAERMNLDWAEVSAAIEQDNEKQLEQTTKIAGMNAAVAGQKLDKSENDV